MKNNVFLLASAFCVGAACASDAKIRAVYTVPGELNDIVGHVQGAACSTQGVYLSHAGGIYKIGWDGRLIRKCTAPVHLGDVGYADGRLYGALAPRKAVNGMKGMIRVWDEDLNVVGEKLLPEPVDGCAVIGDVVYYGFDLYGCNAHRGCKIGRMTRDLRELDVVDTDTGGSCHYGVQTMATDGRNLFCGYYSVGAPRVACAWFTPDLGTCGGTPGLGCSEGFGMIPQSIFPSEHPRFFTVNALNGNCHKWHAVTNPPQIRLDFYEYRDGRFFDVTDRRPPAGVESPRTPAEWADTRVGSSVPGLGSCMPGPCVPHGSVYPSPDTLWPYAKSVGKHAPTSGYHQGDPVTGFSQFHTQGTGGHPSYGIILVTPTCGAGESEAELASPMTLVETRPYLFRARLEKDGIDVRLSATRFGAVYEFTFPEGRPGRVVVNANRKIGRADGGVDVKVVRDGNVVEGGGVYDYNWCPGKYNCFFHAEEERAGNRIVFRIATSFRSVEKARANFAEVKEKSVDDVAAAAKALWEDALGRVRVDGLSGKDVRLFYSHLFHAFVQPRDRTGDIDVWPAHEQMWDDHYTLWDTWKTLFPLMSILDPKAVAGVVNSFSARSEKNGFVGVGFCAGREYRVGQAGDESDNIVADAFAKKIPGVDWERAYAAMKRHAARRTPEYLKLGYVPFGVKTEYCWRMKSGSSTLGFAYNDFCVSQVAAGLGHAEDAAFFLARSKNWTNVWDAAMVDAPSGFTGFCHGRHPDGRFTDVVAREGFQNPPGRTYFGDFYEGSCWEYSFMIPGDIPGMIEKMGGKERFLARLEYAFDNRLIDYGNEPSFITTWLFDCVGRPDLASRWAHVFRAQFEEKEIPGDDDDGAMGAMYVFLTSGIFPIAGQDLYALHAPAARRIAFTLPQSGKTFTIRSELPLDGSAFGKVFLNGKRLARPFITHEQLLAGGELVFR